MGWKRWLKRTIGAVVLVLVVRTGWLVGEREVKRSAGEEDYAAAVAETEATDPNWRWDALNAKRPRPPAGKNGAELIPRVKAATPNDWGLKLNGADREQVANQPANLRYPDELIAEARRELKAAEPAVALAREFKDYPAAYREIVLAPNPLSTLLTDTQHTRHAAALLRWEVVLAVEDGDARRAADDLVAMLNVSRSVGDEPFLISQLVRIATRTVAARSTERTLGQIALPADRLAGLQSAWAADAEEPLLLHGVRGERAAWDELMAHLADGTITMGDLSDTRDTGTFAAFAWWLYRSRIPKNRAFAHRWFGEAVAAARLPLHEQRAALRPLNEKIPRPDDEDLMLARLLLPAVDKVAEGCWRGAAEARCVAVGLACERFRLKAGRWPKDLTELPADLLPGGVPLDPFAGQPLRYRALDDGVIIYSIGPDGADDGGSLHRSSGIPPLTGTDFGFRLWSPEHRRKPPPPPEPRPVPEPEGKP